MSTIAGSVVTPDGVVEGTIDVRDGCIASIAATGPPAARLVLPGFVDLHCHGGAGASFTTGDSEQIARAAHHHRSHGTTTLLASTVTDAPQPMVAAVAALADAVDAGLVDGIHVEGPFLASARCGAQDPRWLRSPDRGLAAELLAAGRGHVRVMTVAPELPGSDTVVTALREHGVIPAVGHTEATATQVREHLGAAPGLVTHLFNGMPPMHHRDAGPVLGALAAAAGTGAVLELVADDAHVSDEVALLLLELLGPTRIALITDAMAAAGLSDGEYELGPQRVRVSDGVARLAEGNSIAGGTSRMIDNVRRLLSAGLPPTFVATAAGATPAGVLGLADRGSLVEGARADLVVLDSEDGSVRVMRGGEWIT